MRVFTLWILLSIAAIAGEIRNDEAAYAFAQREAQIQAQRGRVGHFLGVAPGCRFAGVGQSMSVNNPNHCTTKRYRLVARAYAVSADGRVYWSAQYR